MTATGQLVLEIPVPVRRYSCCGQPCAPLGERTPAPWPHTPGCANPNLDEWIDRATGWPIRRLHCIEPDGSCPTGGRFVARPGLADPHNGRCCLELRARPA